MSFSMEPELAPLYVSWKKDPSPANTDAFMSRIGPIMDAGLRAYGDPANPIHRSQARSIIIGSLPRYNPTKSKFKTFAMSHLQGLRRSSAKYDQVIKIPELMGIGASRIDNIERELEDELGRPPSDDELASRMKVPLKHIARIRGVKSPMSESSLWGSVDDDGDSSIPIIAGSDRDQSAWRHFIYSSLGPVDQVVMERTLSMNGKEYKSTSDLAKMLGISAAAISQRKKKIQEMLDKRFETGIL